MAFRYLLFLFSFFIFNQNSFGKVFESFAGIAQQTIPGVVNIRTKTYVKKSPKQDLYQFFLDGRIPATESTTSVGSGVILSKDGLIVTNYHVIKDADKIEVLFSKDKRRAQATLIGSDIKTDLALLKAEVKGQMTPLSLGDSQLLQVGDVVLAIGNPFGYAHTVTSGIISAKGRVIGTGPYDDFLQTDASIHPGNSGGPLIDMRGRVIGINTAVETQGHGIGFAIPINMVKNVVEDLKKYGKVIRPWMGIVGKNILTPDDTLLSLDQNAVYGVIISNLIVDGPAYKATLKIGDLIMAIDDEKISDISHIQKILMSKKTSDMIRIKIYRREKGFIHLTMGLDAYPKTIDLPLTEDLF